MWNIAASSPADSAPAWRRSCGEYLECQMPRGVGKVDVPQKCSGTLWSRSWYVWGTETAASGAAALASSRTRSRSRNVGLRNANASAFQRWGAR